MGKKMGLGTWLVLAALVALLPIAAWGQQNPITIKVGVSTMLSGGGAAWGMEMKWNAEEACRRINKAGGVNIKGQTYLFEAITYDNKYTAAEGSKVANRLIFDDKVSYVVGCLGSAPILAMQNITEKEKIITFHTSWSPEAYGKNTPYSVGQLDSPETIFPNALPALKKRFPNVKKAAILGPNDQSGWSTAKSEKDIYEKLGIEVTAVEYFERKTAEMYPIVTKALAGKPDIVSLGGTPPGEAALILKALLEMKYQGVRFWGCMPGWKSAVEAAGKEAVEGLLGGLAPDFKGPLSTTIQKELAEGCEQATGVTLSSLGVCTFEAMQALTTAMRKAQSLDSTVVRKALNEVIFESSFGPLAVGYADIWGIPCQFLYPTPVSQIKDGQLSEALRAVPQELKSRLLAAGIDWTKYYKE